MKLNHSSLIVAHGGVWNENIYEGGRKEYIPIPPNGITYEDLLNKLELRLKKDRSMYVFDIDALVKSPAGETMRMKITDDFELSCLMGLLELPTVHVNVSFKNGESSIRIMNVLDKNMVKSVGKDVDAVFEFGLDDVIISDEEDENNVNDSFDIGDGPVESCVRDRIMVDVVPPLDTSDETNEDGIEDPRMWVVAGAAYNASLNCDESPLPDDHVFSDELVFGRTFSSKKKMKLTLGIYEMKNHVQHETARSNKEKFHAVCKFKDGCNFVLRASSFGTAWRIYMWNPHTCEFDLRYHPPPTIPSSVVASYFEPNLMEYGSALRPRDIQSRLRREFGVNINYQAALSGRNHALSLTYGDPDKSFQVLSHFLYMLAQHNPGSIVELLTCEDGTFRYCYFALAACIRAFRSCRPVIVIDGTHLKGKYKGVMFIAATKDANEQIVPLAFAIGDIENDSSWTWFLRQVRQTFGCPEDFLIVSDQHLSIKNAVDSVYPGVHHGLCTFHIQGNLKTWGQGVIDLFKLAANCYKKTDFEENMRNLESASPRAYAKIMSIDPTRWAMSCSPVRRYRCGTSNAAESVNAKLRWARKLPVCPLLECCRKILQQWFYNRRTIAAATTNELSDYASNRLAIAVDSGRSMTVEPISDTKFKVISGTKSNIVDIVSRKCSCLVFDLDLIPCSHAAAAISHVRQSPASYVNAYYSTLTWRKIYAGEVMPIPDPDEWCVPPNVAERVVVTPNNPRQAGRPRTKRILSVSKAMHRRVCSRCHCRGHYQSTCTAILNPCPQPEEEVSSNKPNASKPSASKPRKSNKCGICGVAGHTRLKCQDPSRFA